MLRNTYLVHLTDATRVEEDPLGERGLPRVDVRRDADVADPLQRDDGSGRGALGGPAHADRPLKLTAQGGVNSSTV